MVPGLESTGLLSLSVTQLDSPQTMVPTGPGCVYFSRQVLQVDALLLEMVSQSLHKFQISEVEPFLSKILDDLSPKHH